MPWSNRGPGSSAPVVVAAVPTESAGGRAPGAAPEDLRRRRRQVLRAAARSMVCIFSFALNNGCDFVLADFFTNSEIKGAKIRYRLLQYKKQKKEA